MIDFSMGRIDNTPKTSPPFNVPIPFTNVVMFARHTSKGSQIISK